MSFKICLFSVTLISVAVKYVQMGPWPYYVRPNAEYLKNMSKYMSSRVSLFLVTKHVYNTKAGSKGVI